MDRQSGCNRNFALLKRILLSAAFSFVLLLIGTNAAWCQQFTKVVDNGDDAARLVFAVVGDGYTSSDKAKYESDVDNLVVNGLLGHDFYQRYKKAFNVYRVDAWSRESGVSHPGVPKKTAIDLTFTGNWNDCWIKPGQSTDSGLAWALKPLSKYDYVLIICNESGYGGCCRGNRLFITSGDTWDVVSHEYGHGIGGLFDEYIRSGYTYNGSPVNDHNISTFPDRQKVIWSKMILSGTPVPTSSTDICTNGVGVYEGGYTYEKGAYRPARDCKMNSNSPPFCPVCERLMALAVKDYMPKPSQGFDMKQIQKYLHFDFKVDEAGKWILDKFKESTGGLVLRQNYPSSRFIVESYTNKDNRDAQFVNQDPFNERCFAKKGTKLERTHGAKEGHITVGVPKMTRGEAEEMKLGLRLYQLKPGVNILHIDTASLQTLKEKKSVVLRAEMKPDALATAIRNYVNR